MCDHGRGTDIGVSLDVGTLSIVLVTSAQSDQKINALKVLLQNQPLLIVTPPLQSLFCLCLPLPLPLPLSLSVLAPSPDGCGSARFLISSKLINKTHENVVWEWSQHLSSDND